MGWLGGVIACIYYSYALPTHSCLGLSSHRLFSPNTFSACSLENISKFMDWNYVPTKGTAGGILVGVRSSVFEIINWQVFKYCISSVLEKSSGQYLGLICDESLTCRGLNSNLGHFGSFTFILWFI
jgi:hypothetical protein